MSDRIEAVVEIAMELMAETVAKHLSELHGKKMGVFLCVAPMGERNARADFCTNSDRETAIKWLKASLKMLEDGRVLEDDSKTPEKH